MSNGSERNYISVWTWMWMMLVTAIPIVGVMMIFVWAFTGENESRKNYYRAILLWCLLLVVLIVILTAMGELAQLRQHFETAAPRKL